jgi:hypothetical protein
LRRLHFRAVIARTRGAKSLYAARFSRTFFFESLASGFRAELEANDDGLVTNYPGHFRTID